MLKITDSYYIGGDMNNFTLYNVYKIDDPKSKNYGEDYFNPVGYYSTIDQALHGYMKITQREKTSSKNIYGFDEFIELVQKQNEFLEDLKKKFK